MNNDKRHQGFTMLEILVTIVIFSIIAFTLFSSYQAFISSGVSIKNAVNAEQKGRVVFRRIKEDLQKIYVMHPPQYSVPEFGDEPDLYRLEGTQESVGGSMFSRLSFTSLARAGFSEPASDGPGRITYYVKQTRDEKFDLCRSDLPVRSDSEPDPCTDPILVKDILEFAIIYSDENGGEKTEWDSDSAEDTYLFPGLVNFKIVIAEKERTERFETAFFIPVQREKR